MRIDGEFENIRFTCGSCQAKVTLNRATDLGHTRPVSGEQVQCPECGAELWLAGDIANPTHEMLIFEGYRLFEERRYMLVIAALAQAWEVLFATYARFNFAMRPYFSEDHLSRDVRRLNALLTDVYESTKTFSFDRMLNVVTNCFVQQVHPQSLDQAEAEIGKLADFWKRPGDDNIAAVIPSELGALLGELQKLQTPKLRNRVVHKEAYRPTEAQAQECIDEVRALYRARRLFGLEGAAYWHASGLG